MSLDNTMQDLQDMADFRDFGSGSEQDNCTITEHIPTNDGSKCLCGYFQHPLIKELNAYLNKLWNGAIAGEKLSTVHVRTLERLIKCTDLPTDHQHKYKRGVGVMGSVCTECGYNYTTSSKSVAIKS